MSNQILVTMNLLFALGLICTVLSVSASEFDDEIYVLQKDKAIPANNVHKEQKKDKQRGHDSLEPSFPLFPEWDEFSMNGLDRKLKETQKNFAEERNPPFPVLSEATANKIFKPKKKTKDKFLMTFIEFFVPVMNRKNFDFPDMPRKLDFFEDFRVRDLEEQPLLRHKTQKRFLDFNPFLTFFRNTSSKIKDIFSSNVTSDSASRRHEVLLQKPKDSIIHLQNEINGAQAMPACCANHNECGSNMQCKQGLCNEHEEENAYLSRLKQLANINKLRRIVLLYTVPIILGVGGIVIATEIIRKHKNSKKVKFLNKYDPIQHC